MCMDRRLELSGWIVRTRQNQRTLAVVIAVAAALSVALALWQSQLGMTALGIVVLVSICGFWVTSSRIADWRGQLEQLDPPPRTGLGRRR